MSRLGGITYSRVVEGLELPRPDWNETMKEDPKNKEFIVPKAKGQ